MADEKIACATCLCELPDLDNMKFCPYCGVILIECTAKCADDEEPVLEEELLADAPKKSLEELQQEARAKYEHMLRKSQIKEVLPEENYSLVLKGCESKQHLIDCLNQVLTRGETAIRLAVTTMPAILLYKVSQQAIDTVTAVLKDVDAVFSVVEGDFDYSSFYKSGYFTALDSASKALLKSVPKTMWLGENIRFISDSIFLDEQRGYGILGSDAFYFFYISENGVENILLPAYRLDHIDTWKMDGRCFGELINSDGRTYQLEFESEQDFHLIEEMAEKGI